MDDKTYSDGGATSAAAGTITDAMKDIGGKLGGVARDAAANMGEMPKAAGDAIEGVGRAVRDAADHIGKEAPQVAGYVRDAAATAAATIDKMAGGLRDHTLGNLLDTVTRFGRQQPVAFFAGAIVVGFALSRFVKLGVSEPAPSPEAAPQRGEAAGTGD